MRFYLDEDLPPRVAEMARQRGLDIVSAHEFRRWGMDDRDHLALAAADDRCLVSQNAPDYRALTLEFQAQGFPHAGVLLLSEALPNHAFAAIVEALIQYAGEHPGTAPPYLVDYLRRAREQR
jgi:predicted nuclease of predicted toxin-antitoxin system